MVASLAERLRQETSRAQHEMELPDYLAVRILAIADRIEQGEPANSEIDLLLDQLPLYDTFGQTGYLGMGVNHLILEKTIKRVEDYLNGDL